MIRQSYRATESEHFTELARNGGWDLHYDQIERGKFQSEADYSGGDEIYFFHERYSRAICIHGAAPADVVSFLLPPRPTRAGTFCGSPVTTETLCAFLPSDEGALRTRGDYEFINFSISKERLERALQTLSQTTLSQIVPHTMPLRTQKKILKKLHAAAQDSFAAVHSSEFASDTAVGDQNIEDCVITALCAALVGSGTPNASPLAARNRWRYFRAASHYIKSNLGERLSLEKLCRVSGISEHTLTTAFREVAGLSPQQFIKARRLKAARRALIAARQTGAKVKTVALGLGFWHLGYFARDYWNRFGETPSETAGRQ